MNDFISTAKLAFVGRARWILVGLALVGVAAIAYAHRDHVVGALPYLALLACPLGHLFMFHGHGHDGHERHGAADASRPPPPARAQPDVGSASGQGRAQIQQFGEVEKQR